LAGQSQRQHRLWQFYNLRLRQEWPGDLCAVLNSAGLPAGYTFNVNIAGGQVVIEVTKAGALI
jgi:hypothetical protein